jgi:hypothetical protein
MHDPALLTHWPPPCLEQYRNDNVSNQVGSFFVLARDIRACQKEDPTLR